MLLWGWLGGYKYQGGEVKCGDLLTIEDLGEILHSMLRDFHVIAYLHITVPVNLKDRDEFHLSLEEYLQSLISLVEELVRSNIHTTIMPKLNITNRHVSPAML